MPHSITNPPITAGFYGKLPARGDFVRSGLPRAFIDPWDDWLGRVIAGSRARMGEAWLPAYLESPIWRFSLAPGLCGDQPVLGLMLPSIDRVGRYFPLTFAVLGDIGMEGGAWLDRCEEAGLAALEQECPPDAIIEMIGQPAVALQYRDRANLENHESIWWTNGAPRVPESRFCINGLPDIATYASMLGEGWEQPQTTSLEEASWEPRS